MSWPLVIVTLACGCRHTFFEDVDELRAQERERSNAKRLEILERRQRQIEEVIEKKKGANSTWAATVHTEVDTSGAEHRAAVQPENMHHPVNMLRFRIVLYLNLPETELKIRDFWQGQLYIKFE